MIITNIKHQTSNKDKLNSTVVHEWHQTRFELEKGTKILHLIQK